MRLRDGLCLSIYFLSCLAQAQTYSNGLSVTGYVDGSYNYLLRSNQFISGTNNRVNDITENGFTLQQAAITFAMDPPEGFGGLLNVILGQDANSIAPSGQNPDVFDSQQLALTIPQAFLQYTEHVVTIKVGEFSSLAGLELYDYTENVNFSRSILDGYAQSGARVGLRLINKASDRLNLIVGLGNGWSTIRQSGQLNTLEGGVIYMPYSGFSITVDGSSGKQYLTDTATSGPYGKRNLIDIFATLSLTDQLSIATNLDWANQTKAQVKNGDIKSVKWEGVGGYATYFFTAQWFGAVRGEIFDDVDGYRTGVRQYWREATLTVGYIPIKNLQIRAETRHDISNVGAFLDKNGHETSNNQQSYALEMLYEVV